MKGKILKIMAQMILELTVKVSGPTANVLLQIRVHPGYHFATTRVKRREWSQEVNRTVLANEQ